MEHHAQHNILNQCATLFHDGYTRFCLPWSRTTIPHWGKMPSSPFPLSIPVIIFMSMLPNSIHISWLNVLWVVNIWHINKYLCSWDLLMVNIIMLYLVSNKFLILGMKILSYPIISWWTFNHPWSIHAGSLQSLFNYSCYWSFWQT